MVMAIVYDGCKVPKYEQGCTISSNAVVDLFGIFLRGKVQFSLL
jgi:hypothetical protein